MTTIKCDYCKQIFQRKASAIKRYKHHFCNNFCRGKYFIEKSYQQIMPRKADNDKDCYKEKNCGYNTKCWVWKFSKANGYGFGTYKGKHNYSAHRYFYEKYVGEIPKNYQIDHLCRNHSCVNPNHLEPVTAAKNAQRGNQAKLSWSDVNNIRMLAKIQLCPNKQLAKLYDVSYTTIHKIIDNKRWITIKNI